MVYARRAMKMVRSASLALVMALCGASACKNNNPTPTATTAASDAGATTATPAATDAGALPTTGPSEAVPSHALVAIRGGGLRKVLSFIAPGAPLRLALGQVIPGITPGVEDHGVDIDPDAPFGALMVAGDGPNGQSSLSVVAAWPLRPGMQIAQDAQALRGWRLVRANIYAPTEDRDAGRGATPCWLARRAPVGWTMLCGPREVVDRSASWLVAAASAAPENNAVLDATVRPERARAVFASQLTALEAQDPRANGQGSNRERVAAFDEALRSARNTRQLIDDMRSLHATLTLDETNYHLRGDGEFGAATGASTRALIGTAVGHRAAADLLAHLPATVTSYFASGFDMTAFAPLLGPNEPDPRAAQMLGPEFVRFQQALADTTGFRRSGERAMGFTTDDGGTKVELIRVPDPAAALTSLRNAALAVPRTPRPSGMNAADQFAILPTPAGLPAGTLRMRLGPDPARLPPNVPAEVRRQFQRTVLLVPQEGYLLLVEAGDPVARFRALSEGARLTVTAPEGRALVLHLTAPGILALLGAPAGAATGGEEPIVGNLDSRRVGDNGGHFDLSVDAPITTVNVIRDTIAALQEQQMRQMQAQRQAMQQAQQAQQQQMRRAAGGGGGVAAPEPNFQLQRPGMQ